MHDVFAVLLRVAVLLNLAAALVELVAIRVLYGDDTSHHQAEQAARVVRRAVPSPLPSDTGRA